jgi:voltage-gated potassium channel
MRVREKINELIEPRNDNPFSRIYDGFMLCAIVVGIMPLMFREQCRVFVYFDWFSCCCFLIDYVLRWLTADLRSKKKSKMAFLVYPFTLMAILDILSILPTFNLVNQLFKVARVSRLLKIIRVLRVIRYYEPLEITLSVVRRQRKVLWIVFSLAFFYVFITALIMFNAEEDINPETGRYLFHNFFDAFYWATCTLTTVGYGDLYPISETGRVISIISSMVGIAIVALPSGIITAGYVEELRRRKGDKNLKTTNRL